MALLTNNNDLTTENAENAEEGKSEIMLMKRGYGMTGLQQPDRATTNPDTTKPL
jgi:hypothetical protein